MINQEFIDAVKILKTEKMKIFNMIDGTENEKVASFLNIYENQEKILFICNKSEENQTVYFDFKNTTFALEEFIKKEKIYMFYDLISDRVRLKHGFDILENGKESLDFSISPNGVVIFKVFQFVGFEENSRIKIKSLETLYNYFSILVKKKGLNFESEIFLNKDRNDEINKNKNLLKVIENLVLKIKTDAHFYYENDDSYNTFFARGEYDDKKQDLLFVFNDNNCKENFKFLRSDIFTYKKDNTKKTFFIFEDLLSNEVFIRDAKELKKKGLAVKLNISESHLFRFKKVVDNEIMLMEMLFEQTQYKSIKMNDFFEKIFNNNNEIVDLNDIVNIYSMTSDESSDNMSWMEKNLPDLKSRNIVYLCMEMFIPELYEMKENEDYNGAVDANFSGGLGILAGCTLEGFGNIGLNSCAIIPMYRKRRLQRVNFNLEQEIYEEEIDYTKNKNLRRLIDEETDIQLEIQVFVEDKKYSVKVWEIYRKDSKIYLLEEPEIFDILYTGSRDQRLKQEVLFGKVVPVLLKSLNIKPSIVHLNEAHPIIAAVQMKDWKNISLGDDFFEDTRILFTIHTPRTAGMEVFFVNFNKLEIPYYFKPIFDKNNSGKLDFTNAAIEISDRVNTVSDNQIRIVKERIFTDDKFHRKIIGIMNGSSKSYWTSENNKKFYDMNEQDIKCYDLWQEHKFNKKEAIDYIKTVFYRENIFDTLNVDKSICDKLSESKPSAWAIRRIVDYKNQWPLLKDIIRIICSEKGTFIDSIFGKMEGLGFQVVIGGMAHPNDQNSQQWIKEFILWMKGYWRDDLSKEYVEAPELFGNFFFLPSFRDGLGKILKISAIGGDVCLEIPTWDEEACGTSGMRALGNGNICIDSSDGALEWLDDNKNSFMLKPYESLTILKYMQKISQMYSNLLSKEQNVNPLDLEYDEFLNMKKQAILTWKNKIDVDIMSQRYAREMFYPAVKASEIIKNK